MVNDTTVTLRRFVLAPNLLYFLKKIHFFICCFKSVTGRSLITPPAPPATPAPVGVT